jgi:hypothetical protein
MVQPKRQVVLLAPDLDIPVAAVVVLVVAVESVGV